MKAFNGYDWNLNFQKPITQNSWVNSLIPQEPNAQKHNIIHTKLKNHMVNYGSIS